MKKGDYIVCALALLISTVLLALSECALDSIMFAIWLAIIAVFIVAMNCRKLRKARRNGWQLKKTLDQSLEAAR